MITIVLIVLAFICMIVITLAIFMRNQQLKAEVEALQVDNDDWSRKYEKQRTRSMQNIAQLADEHRQSLIAVSRQRDDALKNLESFLAYVSRNSERGRIGSATDVMVEVGRNGVYYSFGHQPREYDFDNFDLNEVTFAIPIQGATDEQEEHRGPDQEPEVASGDASEQEAEEREDVLLGQEEVTE